MSERPSSRLSELARMGLIAASLVGSLSIGGGSFVAVAQEATPDATPMAECVPGVISEAPAEATPAADMAASPVAEEEPVGTPADEASVEAATAFVNNLVACASDPDALATLVTPRLVQELGGYSSIEEASADGFFVDIPYAGGVTVGNVISYDDGSLGVEIQYAGSQYQVSGEEWRLVQDDGAWKLDAISPAPVDVEGDTVAVGINLLETEDGTYAIEPNTSSVVQSEVLILQGINPETNQEPHELVVLQLPEGADPMGLLDGSIPEEDVTFIGVVFGIEPGESADLVLVNLPAGQYVLACFIPGPDGAPHAAHGMVAPFEVTAPAE